MTASLADLNPTPDELAKLHHALADVLSDVPPDALTASLGDLGLDAFDRIELACAVETRFGVALDDHFASEHTAADLLAAVRAAPKLGELPHA